MVRSSSRALARDLDQVHRRLAPIHGHRSDDQSQRTVDSMLPRPGKRETVQARELPRADRLASTDERPQLPRLHFDEHDTATIVTDEVDLPIPRPRVARDDPNSRPLKCARGRSFTEIAQDPPRIRHDWRSDRAFGRA